ncbi:Gibberellin-regulated protein 1 [Turnera subulata]|uniref:Gibberellin-regulated protein 1 n=1 Tax=Turnera subulata TaxID=218843 RepID=A0A9Q0GGJ9_9ROSI|nr:Gibberellin-regulated protein 1 [Turnera subulata]KAJ4849492.1 Gibberellin-regulated protein 1 [Turnera subulata]
MAISKPFIASLVLVISIFLFHLVEANQPEINESLAASYAPPKMDCGSACVARCQLSSRHNLCLRACGTCCARCNCVPPGTSGNQETCPCYASLTTHGGRRKCP